MDVGNRGATTVQSRMSGLRRHYATTSAWDAMDEVTKTRHTAPWAGWRRAEMKGDRQRSDRQRA